MPDGQLVESEATTLVESTQKQFFESACDTCNNRTTTGAEPQSKAPTQPPTQTPAPPPKPPLSDTAKRFRKLAEELDKEGGQ